MPADGSPPSSAPDGGALLGLFPRLDLEEQVLELAPGDLLALYTDGVTDAASSSGDRFGYERFVAELAANREAGTDPPATVEAVVGRVVDAVLAFQGEQPAADDLALLAIRRPGGRR